MKCYLCDSKSFKKIKKGVRDNIELIVLRCSQCELVTLNSFEHIDENFYANSKMHSSKVDINNWLLETEKDDSRRYLFLFNKIKDKNILDFGTGNAGFLIKAREVSTSACGVEPEVQFKSFFQENNLKVFGSLKQLNNKKFDLITAFHVFEHLKNPLEILKNLIEYLAEDGELIIEVPNSDDALLSYYNSRSFSDFTYWSQHLFLFNEKNLIALVKKAGFKINYIKQIQRYPLSNHLYWLAKGLPNGHNKFLLFNNEKLNQEYEKVLKKEQICDTLLVSVKKM